MDEQLSLISWVLFAKLQLSTAGMAHILRALGNKALP